MTRSFVSYGSIASLVAKASLLGFDPRGNDAKQRVSQAMASFDRIALRERERKSVDNLVERAVAIEIEHSRQSNDDLAFAAI
jgi:hypothetical protein